MRTNSIFCSRGSDAPQNGMDYAKVLKLPQYFRNLHRLSEILAVLVKHGFGDLVNRFNIFLHGETSVKLANPSLFLEKRAQSLSVGTRLRLVCEELGPTFIKLGQLVATRPDAFPESVISEFRKLQDKVPPFPSEQAVEILERELGAPLERRFRRFQKQPLAAGSIAQVHRAELCDGTQVVVKIRRPNIERLIDTDMDIVRGLAALLEENVPELESIGPLRIAEEFHRTLRRECDFRKEAHHMTLFAQQHREETALIVPGTFPRLCGARVLTMEYIEGRKIDELILSGQHLLDGPALARALTKVVLDSLFKHRFFHADPHLGNVLITSDNRVALIDYGAMGRIDRQRMYVILRFIAATLAKEPERMLQILKDEQLAPEEMDEASVRVQIWEILDSYLGKSLGALDLSRLLSEVFEVVRRYGIKPPPDVLMIAKSLTTLESIGTVLDPTFDPVQVIKPYVTSRYLHYLTDPRVRLERLRGLAESYQSLAADFPESARTVLGQLARGSLTLQTVDRNYPLIKEHQNRLLNRALLGALSTALLALGLLLRAFYQAGADSWIAYVLIALGIYGLLRTWLAIFRSGGI